MWILEARKWGGSVTGPAGWQGGRDDDKHREGRKTGKEEGRGGEGRGGEKGENRQRQLLSRAFSEFCREALREGPPLFVSFFPFDFPLLLVSFSTRRAKMSEWKGRWRVHTPRTPHGARTTPLSPPIANENPEKLVNTERGRGKKILCIRSRSFHLERVSCSEAAPDHFRSRFLRIGSGNRLSKINSLPIA